MIKDEKGFGVIELLTIIVIFVTLGIVAWYIHYQKSATHTSQSSLISYKDTNDGLSFSYPSRWGTVRRHQIGDADRQAADPNGEITQYDFTFTKAPLFLLPIANGQDNYLEESDSACFVPFILLNNSEFGFKQPAVSNWAQSPTSPPNNYTTYKKVLVSNKQTFVAMDFEVSTVVNSQDYCNGLSVYGSQVINKNDQGLQKVDFLWSQTATTFGKDQPKGGLRDLADFKRNQAKYISDQDLHDLQLTVASLHAF